MLRTFTLFPLFWLLALAASAQGNHPIYKIEERLMKGDKEALFDIAPFLDNKEQITEFLGHHLLKPSLRGIARRILRENCLFTDQEFVFNDSATWQKFNNFLLANKERITFSPLTTSFLITPFEQKAARVELRKLTETRRRKLIGQSPDLLQAYWIREQRIDSFLLRKDPYALVLIASELFKGRERLNKHQYNTTDYLNLLALLTETEIGVENEKKEISWHINKDYYPDSRLNLLIYFTRSYQAYKWDDEQSIFINPHLTASIPGKEEALFQLLGHENDSIAMDAFTQLTTCSPEKVISLSKEYDQADIDRNYQIPIFPYKFLPQLALLTAYCRTNNILYNGSPGLMDKLRLLQNDDLPFSQKYQLENELVNTLSLDDITAFEYWALLHEESSWEATFSAGRVLDMFYSRNWPALLADKKHLDLYLKKSLLFNRLGIVGICNNYLKKFSSSSPSVLNLLSDYPTDDSDIKTQTVKIVAANKNGLPKKKQSVHAWDGNKDDTVTHLEQKLTKLTAQTNNYDENHTKIQDLLSKISYQQIPTAFRCIEDYLFKDPSDKYAFIQDDFGLFIPEDLEDEKARKDFMDCYAKYTEYQLYAHYLDKAGFDYKKKNNTLDYDKIYEMLKYDIVTAFTGGGNSKQNNEVYSLVKLLELTFKTTLGFPAKLCSSQNMYACHPGDRADAWMKYLEDKKLLTRKHDEPVSFTYE